MLTTKFHCTLSFILGLAAASTAFANDPITIRNPDRLFRRPPPIALPIAMPKQRVGARFIFPPIHKFPVLNVDHPIVHPMINMFQLDQRYADLFADNGSSQICGATAMANAMVYLRHNHAPAFPRILEDSMGPGSTNADAVRVLFDLCHTSRNNGTLVSDMRDCARTSLEQGDYNTANTFIRGIHSDLSSQRFAPGTGDLRVMSQTSWHAGDDVSRSDRAVVMLFGWYSVNWDAGQNAWVYQRNGGHYVTLAGYDAVKSDTFYVSNPLVDYNAPGFGSIRYSKITLEAIPNRADLKTPGGFQGLWQARDLVGGNLAVLEDMVISLPWN